MTEKRLTVQGVGKISLPPDRIVIEMSVETKDKDYNTVTDKQFEKTEEIKNAVAEVGFDRDKLKTAKFEVNADYENVQNDKGGWERKFVGYRCAHCLSLKFDFDIEKLKWVISAITACKNANPSFTISFTVKDREETYNKLLELAIKDAVGKAAVLSAAANVNLGDIVSINYGSQEEDFISPTGMAAALYKTADCARGAAADISIQPEDIRSELNVTVVWEINP